MERIVNITKNFEEARQWEIEQGLAMTPDERMSVVKSLIERVYGKNQPDVREIKSNTR